MSALLNKTFLSLSHRDYQYVYIRYNVYDVCFQRLPVALPAERVQPHEAGPQRGGQQTDPLHGHRRLPPVSQHLHHQPRLRLNAGYVAQLGEGHSTMGLPIAPPPPLHLTYDCAQKSLSSLFSFLLSFISQSLYSSYLFHFRHLISC